MPPVKIASIESLHGSVGRELATSDWLVITQERISAFAEATGDRQRIHLDRERAEKESPYGATIAHGFLTLSLLSSLMQDAMQFEQAGRHAINYGLNRVRFPAPVRAGTEIRARVTLLSQREFPKGVEATFEVFMEGKAAAKPCCVAEWIVRYYT